jgi:hypothetical protein
VCVFTFGIINKPGAYFVAAQFIGTNASDQNSNMVGVDFMPYWTGAVVSNRLRF